MPSPEPLPSEDGPDRRPVERRDDAGANTDWLQLVAAAADLCRKPLRHGVVCMDETSAAGTDLRELNLRLEARTPEGERCPEEDLELEIYPSGRNLNLMLAWCRGDHQPMLWQGQHPVWMDANGVRCATPAGGAPIEALARRLRALLLPG
ncbi:MAG: hypothetical protein ACKO0M_07640 [Cyanobium sp.]